MLASRQVDGVSSRVIVAHPQRRRARRRRDQPGAARLAARLAGVLLAAVEAEVRPPAAAPAQRARPTSAEIELKSKKWLNILQQQRASSAETKRSQLWGPRGNV